MRQPSLPHAENGIAVFREGEALPNGTFRLLPGYCEATLAKEPPMDSTTLIVLIIILFFVFGGGWYGRGRWY